MSKRKAAQQRFCEWRALNRCTTAGAFAPHGQLFSLSALFLPTIRSTFPSSLAPHGQLFNFSLFSCPLSAHLFRLPSPRMGNFSTFSLFSCPHLQSQTPRRNHNPHKSCSTKKIPPQSGISPYIFTYSFNLPAQ